MARQRRSKARPVLQSEGWLEPARLRRLGIFTERSLRVYERAYQAALERGRGEVE